MVAAQRTVKAPVTITGVGLQTGEAVTLTIKSAPADSGIQFIRTDLPDAPPFKLTSLEFNAVPTKERRTAFGAGPFIVETTEHLLAALAGLGIDNASVELDKSELPGLDGSAKGFVDAIQRVGVVEQDVPKRVLQLTAPVWCELDGAFLAVFPSETPRISYTLSYNRPALGDQFFTTTMSEDAFVRDIAPARTFCLEEEALVLLQRGLGKGANYENTLVMGKTGPINNTLRFPNEPVRHKILDLIGDLYLVGMPLAGHVVALRSGHRLNMELVKRLKEKE